MDNKYFAEKKKEYLEIKKNKIFNQENYFSKNIYAYDNKIINYISDFGNKAYIGLAKTPLMPNDNGIGFKGVKLQSPNRELIMCNECGEFFTSISTFHLKKHNITFNEYKEKYGYNKSTSLASDVRSNICADIMIERNFKFKEKFDKTRDMSVVSQKIKRVKLTSEMQNNRGTCPEQLKQKIVNHIERFKMLPYKTNGRDGFVGWSNVVKKHGNLKKTYEFYGLPTRKHLSRGLNEWKFADGTIHYISKKEDYGELYFLIKNKCEIMKTL